MKMNIRQILRIVVEKIWTYIFHRQNNPQQYQKFLTSINFQKDLPSQESSETTADFEHATLLWCACTVSSWYILSVISCRNSVHKGNWYHTSSTKYVMHQRNSSNLTADSILVAMVARNEHGLPFAYDQPQLTLVGLVERNIESVFDCYSIQFDM